MTPCLIENSWSFYPHKGVEVCQTTYGSGYGVNPERDTIPGSIQAPIPHFQAHFSGSNGTGVHTNGK